MRNASLSSTEIDDLDKVLRFTFYAFDRVAIERKTAQMTDTIVFTRGVPPPEAFPAEELSLCFESALSNDAAVVLQYGQQPGYAPLRKLLAAEFGVADNQLLVGNGSLHLQDLVSAFLIKPGMTVLTEQPSYDRAI